MVGRKGSFAGGAGAGQRGLSRLRPRRGFTLIELLCVLAILAATAALVAPRLSGSFARSRLEDQARNAVVLCRQARALAAAEGRAALLVVDAEAESLRVLRRRDPLAPAAEGDDPELEVPEGDGDRWTRPVPFIEGVRLASAEVDGFAVEEGLAAQVEFAPDGSATPAWLVFESTAGAQLAVEVAGASGLARVAEAEGSP